MSQENSKAGNYSDVSISISQAEYSMSQNAKNANSPETSFPDLHTIYSNNVSEISGEIQRNETNTPTDNRSENSSNEMSNDVPGCLPEYVEVNRPQLVNWNRNSDGEIITINSSLIDDAYIEITTWRKNTFLVPNGKTGRDFIDQLIKHIDNWNNGTIKQQLALKAAIVLLTVGLQKSSQKSKAKDHQECLKKRLKL